MAESKKYRVSVRLIRFRIQDVWAKGEKEAAKRVMDALGPDDGLIAELHYVRLADKPGSATAEEE